MTKLTRRFSKQRGFTLIEFITVIAFSAILLIIVIGITVQILVQTRGGEETFKAQSDALSVMHRLTKEIRQATEVVAAGEQTITFREYVDADDIAPSQVRFYLNGSELIRGEIPPTGVAPNYTYDPDDETFDTLSFRVINGADPIFTYFDQDGTVLADPIPLAAITLVDINLGFEQFDNPRDFKTSTKVQLRFNKSNL